MENTGTNPNISNVLVIGLARSGCAAAELLLDEGFDVRVSELRAAPDVRERRKNLEARGAVVETGTHSPGFLEGIDLVVTSPGVPENNPLIWGALQGGIEVIGELELASRYIRTPVIAVTGTNGKTTTVSLITHCLKHAGRKVVLAGNTGIPLSSVIEEAAVCDWLVLEVSSYQLAHTSLFHPVISVFLNMASDHLDRYGSLEEYFAHKRRLFTNQTHNDTAVLNDEEDKIRSIGDEIDARVLTFSRSGEVREGAFIGDESIRLSLDGEQVDVLELKKIPLPGWHNKQNVLASVCALASADCTLGEIREGVESFEGLPHRLEELDTFQGIKFVNDSKATNVSSTYCAIDGVRGPIVLIMGGRHKGEPYSRLLPLVRSKVKHLVVIGEAAELIKEDLSGAVAATVCRNLDDAVQAAVAHAKPGDTVLLSPGCSSFDMFTDYEERGDTFRELIHGLGK